MCSDIKYNKLLSPIEMDENLDAKAEKSSAEDIFGELLRNRHLLAVYIIMFALPGLSDEGIVQVSGNQPSNPRCYHSYIRPYGSGLPPMKYSTWQSMTKWSY